MSTITGDGHYAGLDVSLDTTSVCILDAHGAVVWRGQCASTAEAIRDALRKHAPALVRVGLETGLLSNWLTHSLRGMRLPVSMLHGCVLWRCGVG